MSLQLLNFDIQVVFCRKVIWYSGEVGWLKKTIFFSGAFVFYVSIYVCLELFVYVFLKSVKNSVPSMDYTLLNY